MRKDAPHFPWLTYEIDWAGDTRNDIPGAHRSITIRLRLLFKCLCECKRKGPPAPARHRSNPYVNGDNIISHNHLIHFPGGIPGFCQGWWPWKVPRTSVHRNFKRGVTPKMRKFFRGILEIWPPLKPIFSSNLGHFESNLGKFCQFLLLVKLYNF